VFCVVFRLTVNAGGGGESYCIVAWRYVYGDRFILHRYAAGWLNEFSGGDFANRISAKDISVESTFPVVSVHTLSPDTSADVADGHLVDHHGNRGVARTVSDDLKHYIADIVCMFGFVDGRAGGNCMARALLGHAVLTECGISSSVVCGALLYRVGKHRMRDTLRFSLPDNTGGYYCGHLIGHIWNEVDDDIVDFSSGDWMAEAQEMYERATDPADRKLGPVEWRVTPPAFIWQAAHSLKSGWRPHGQPTIGTIWYGPWSCVRSPDYHSHDKAVRSALPLVRQFVADARLRERIAELPVTGIPT
jgi:hypothetical protein